MEETVILEFKVDQAAAQKSLEQTEKNLIDLKDAQRDLTKEYNKGNITQNQYVRENLKLQNSIKKEQDQKRTLIKTVETESNSRNALRLQISKLTREYDNLNQETAEGAKRAKELETELNRLTTQLSKGNKEANLFKNEIGNYPAQFGEAASQINVAGISVGDITSKLASFANPATAAVGIVTALGAAYASSSTGARDLANATNILSGAYVAVNNSFAEFLNSATGGTGDPENGIFSFLVGGILNKYAPALNAIGQLSAAAKKELKLLELAQLDSQAAAKKALDEAEKLRRQRDDDANTLEDRLRFANDVGIFIDQRERALVQVQEDRLKALNTLLALDKNNLELQKEVKQTQFEISDIQEDSQGKRTEALNAIIQLEKELLELQKENAQLARATERATERAKTSDDAAILTGTTDVSSIPLVQPKSSQDAAIEAQREFAKTLLKVNEDYYYADLRNKKAAAELKEKIDEQQLQNTANFLGQGAALFEENTDAFKLFASASTLISTYSAAQKAYEAAFLPVPTIASPALGTAFAAIAVATGLANLSKINGVEFAEGGYTGQGAKYDVAGVVHKGEYVTPKSVVESPAAQPHLAALERMRSGYADGGFVTNRSIDSSQQALIMANAFKNLPAPVVGVREITSVQNRIGVREKAARI